MINKKSPPLEPITFTSVFIFALETLYLFLLLLPSVAVALVKNLFFKPKKNLKGKIVLRSLRRLLNKTSVRHENGLPFLPSSSVTPSTSSKLLANSAKRDDEKNCDGDYKPQQPKILISKVTGAGNGLGKEIALQLSKQGSIILCIDIKEEDNKKTLKQILESNGKGRAYTCDVSDPIHTKALSEIILDEFGRVDVLINNAGLIFGNGILTGTNEEILRVLSVNFMSNLWMIRAFLPNMIRNNDGHIVCIGSASGIHSLGQGNIYSCTKFALLGLIYSMLEEFRKNDQFKNIKVSCALPYFINTNKLYSEHWKLRLPALSTEKAASLVIEGFRREFKLYTVPWIAFGYNISSSLRIFPLNVYNFFRDKCYADFTFDDSSQTKL